MNRVLVIYELVPEDTKLYNLTVSDEDFEKLKKCHGNIGNTVGSDDDLTAWLGAYLEKHSEYQKTTPFPFTGTIILSGFVL